MERFIMESYIQISKINDFMFCPLSLYLRGVNGEDGVGRFIYWYGRMG